MVFPPIHLHFLCTFSLKTLQILIATCVCLALLLLLVHLGLLQNNCSLFCSDLCSFKAALQLHSFPLLHPFLLHHLLLYHLQWLWLLDLFLAICYNNWVWCTFGLWFNQVCIEFFIFQSKSSLYWFQKLIQLFTLPLCSFLDTYDNWVRHWQSFVTAWDNVCSCSYTHEFYWLL